MTGALVRVRSGSRPCVRQPEQRRAACRRRRQPVQGRVPVDVERDRSARARGTARPTGPQGPQGAPGDDHIFGVATTGSLTSHVLNIPELGEITVDCNGTGTASFHLVANRDMEFARRERDSDGGSNGRRSVFHEDITPAAPAGTIVWYWLVGEGNGCGWVLRIHMRPILLDLSCTAAVTVTRIG